MDSEAEELAEWLERDAISLTGPKDAETVRAQAAAIAALRQTVERLERELRAEKRLSSDISDSAERAFQEVDALRSQVEALRGLTDMVVEKNGEIVCLDMKIDGQYVNWFDRRTALQGEDR